MFSSGGGWGWTGGKGYSSKLNCGRKLMKPKNQPGGVVLAPYG